LGFVLHGHEKILIRQFTDDVETFKSALINGTARHETGWNEFGLPALDVVADFPWQKKRHFLLKKWKAVCEMDGRMFVKFTSYRLKQKRKAGII